MPSILIPADPDLDVRPIDAEDHTQGVAAAVGVPFAIFEMPELREQCELPPGLPIVMLAQHQGTPGLAPNFRATRLYGEQVSGDVVIAHEHDGQVVELDPTSEAAVLGQVVSPNEALLALAGAVDGLLVKAVQQLVLVLPADRIEAWLRARFDNLCAKVHEELGAS